MRNRVILLILTCLILAMLIILGECGRAPTPEGITSSITAIQVTSQQGPIEPSIQPTEQATELIVEPTIEQPYPLPTNPTIPETMIPYPGPSDETTIPTVESTPGEIYPPPVSTTTQPATQLPQGNQTQITPSQTATATPTITPSMTPVATETSTTEDIPAYPGASPYPTIGETLPYPGPEISPTSPNYPGPFVTPTLPSPVDSPTQPPMVTQTPSRTATSGPTPTILISPTSMPTQGLGTPVASPTEMPPRAPLSPPPAGSSVTIWHSWGSAETAALQSIIQSFQRLYPDVTFSIQYIPQDDLYNSYYNSAYLGQGPSLLLGPSNWGSELFDDALITDLKSYVPANYLSIINPVALASGEYNDALISLPLSQHGLLMFRNNTVILTPALSLDALKELSKIATHGGVVGSYLERGAYFSAPAIIGLGGQLMDKDGYPAFNDEFGVEWFELLQAYDEAGAVTFNTNWDLEKFKQGRVGVIIDGSWNIPMLAQTMGGENLSIDPWPAFSTGHMSGWVETDSIFLNSNTIGNNRFAALSFIGYLLDPNVQMRLAEVGHIPSVITTQPRDPLIKQAMKAFMDGVPYPMGIDDSVLSIYRYHLDKAISDVFTFGVTPANALQTADENIKAALDELE